MLLLLWSTIIILTVSLNIGHVLGIPSLALGGQPGTTGHPEAPAGPAPRNPPAPSASEQLTESPRHPPGTEQLASRPKSPRTKEKAQDDECQKLLVEEEKEAGPPKVVVTVATPGEAPLEGGFEVEDEKALLLGD